jgi:hypothetical protein
MLKKTQNRTFYSIRITEAFSSKEFNATINKLVMCSSFGYKTLPYVLGLMSLIEMVLGIIRIVIFFGDKPPDPPSNFLSITIFTGSSAVTSPFLSSTQAKAGFSLDWIASIIPTFMGIYVVVFMLAACCSLCFVCSCVFKGTKNTREDLKNYANCCKFMCGMCTSKPNHRCVSLTWNCPCYKARPQLRFQVRFGLLTSFIVLRIIAIILYATDKSVGVYGGQMAVICTISVCFVVLMMAIDFYQYRVWWYYRPDGIYKKFRCLCCKQKFHPSHQRFLPAPLLGKYRENNIIGNRPCENTVSGYCPDLSLEHIVIFHAFDFKPLRRYRLGIDKTYIGFHRTKPEFAVGISQTGFHRSMKPPQMLGFGVYFARSFADTDGKARAAGKSFYIDNDSLNMFDIVGAFICAEIRMGEVRVVKFSEIDEVRNTDSWWSKYDTIYYAHAEENRDEFCIKDPEQILKWVIIMDDDRLRRYGLDHEFDNTRCGCI